MEELFRWMEIAMVLEEEVIESYEWNDPDEGIENGFLVVVIGDVMRMNYKR
jgi:hypothetical protein